MVPDVDVGGPSEIISPCNRIRNAEFEVCRFVSLIDDFVDILFMTFTDPFHNIVG